MPRIRTPSRLHFGLLEPSGRADPWPDRAGQPVLPGRAFGGVGLMVEQPGLCVQAEPAAAWAAEGPLADRALTFALRFARSAGAGGQPGARPPLRLVVESAAPEHAGLGTGTQLALAVARAAAACWDLHFPVEELARRVGRGGRSGVGAHGFAHGGFLVDGGRREQGLAPLVARVPFP